MLRLFIGCAVGFASMVACVKAPAPRSHEPPPPSSWGLLVHGGAGSILPGSATPERDAAVRRDLEQALRAGHTVLASGGASVDAVAAAVVVLEDSPWFNAGKGAVFTHDGTNELDAAIMVGRPLAAGAVAGLRTIKNPILLARAVMERSPHVMMVSDGAERFADQVGVARVDPSYFRTDERWQQLQDSLARERAQARAATPAPRTDYYGTVGAVALDRAGVLAAATSTGGMTNKRYGRVGDAPVIGAGTYANHVCAVSATGHGEHFIRHAVAHDICARTEYLGVPLARAAEQVVMEKLAAAGGDGGVIAIDRQGNMTMPFNSERMYRGYIGADGVPHVALYREAP